MKQDAFQRLKRLGGTSIRSQLILAYGTAIIDNLTLLIGRRSGDICARVVSKILVWSIIKDQKKVDKR